MTDKTEATVNDAPVGKFRDPELAKLERENEGIRVSRAVLIWLGGLVILGLFVVLTGGGGQWTP